MSRRVDQTSTGTGRDVSRDIAQYVSGISRVGFAGAWPGCEIKSTGDRLAFEFNFESTALVSKQLTI